MAVLLQTPILNNYMLHFPAWIGGFSALWCFCMWCFPHHCTSNFMGKIESLLHPVLATDWLPRIHADCIYSGCKSGPISHSRMCKGHWGCFSVLISCIFVLQKHGGILVHSISLVSFPESECLLQHDVPPKSGFSFSIPMDRSSIGTFHFRNSWASVCSFHADLHECHPRCSWAGSQAVFVIMGKIWRLSMCHWTGNAVAFDSNSHFFKSSLQSKVHWKQVLLPTGNTQDFDAFSHTIVWHFNLLDGDSVNIPLCDNLGAMEWLKLLFPISIHRCHTKNALMQWSINW